MVELVEYIVRQLVSEPDSVKVTMEEIDGVNQVFVSVAPQDTGKIIGKQGKIAKALRTLVRCAASKEGKKYNIEIKEKEKAE